jgi:ABC-type xylose transport system permease subunit
MALSHPILTTDNTPTRSVNAWTRAVGFLRSRPWMVAVVASLLIVLVLLPLSERNGIDLLISNVYLASFIAVAALGQMLVVSTGRGAIDLSIPFTITLCVYIATIVQNGTDDNLLASIGVTILVGTLVGAVNGFAVVVLRVPAMVATLAVGFIAQSVVQIIASTTGNNGPSPAITAAARGNVFGIAQASASGSWAQVKTTSQLSSRASDRVPPDGLPSHSAAGSRLLQPSCSAVTAAAPLWASERASSSRPLPLWSSAERSCRVARRASRAPSREPCS